MTAIDEKIEAAKERDASLQNRRSDKNAEIKQDDRQHVTFVIGAETYGVEVLNVQEIIGMTQITHVPIQ